MPRECAVCGHPDRQAVEEAILANASNRAIARQWRVSKDSVRRHVESGHVSARVAKAHAAAEVANADDLLQQLKALKNKAISLLVQAEREGDIRTALAGVKEARGCLEVLMEVEGELDRRGTVNIVIAPEWVRIRTTLIVALQPYPEARQAVAGALQMIEGGTGHAAD